MRAFWLIVPVLLVAGCGRQPPPPPEAASPNRAAAPASAPAPDPRPVIACFGDSLTAGYGAEPGESYPSVMQRRLDAAGYRYRVANFGASGDTTQDGLARLGVVLDAKPAWVVLEFGANDGLRGIPVGLARKNLDQLVRALRGAGARVVLAGMTLPPNYGAAYIRPFETMYPQLAAQYQLPLVPFLLAGVGGNSALMQQDGLHPNARGYAQVAANVLATLEPLLQKQPGTPQ